jgi:hypothetical protein
MTRQHAEKEIPPAANAGHDDVPVLRVEIRQTQRPAPETLRVNETDPTDRTSSNAPTRQNPPVGLRTLDSPAEGSAIGTSAERSLRHRLVSR